MPNPPRYIVEVSEGKSGETIPSPFPNDGTAVGIVSGKAINASPSFPIRKLGEGTFGNVYSFHDGCRLRAAKITKDANNGGIDLNYFIEVLNTSRLGKHPNVVKMIDCVLTPANTIIVFERQSTSLDKMIKEYPNSLMPKRLAKKLALDIALGMEYVLLEADLLHADLKPSNILIEKLPQGAALAKIADFGISRPYLRRCRPPQYEEVFTLWWRPPEILLEGPYEPCADVWAFGCIVAEMLTGKIPFVGNSEAEMLTVIFSKLGYPGEKTWPGMTKLDAFNTSRATPFTFDLLSETARKLGIIMPDNRSDSVTIKFSQSSQGLDLGEQVFLDKILVINPVSRPTITCLVDNPWFDDIRPDISRPVEYNRIDVLRLNGASQKVYRIRHPEIRGRVYSIITDKCRLSGIPGKTRSLTMYLFERYLFESGSKETGDWDSDKSVFIPIVDQCLTFAKTVVANTPDRHGSSNVIEKDVFTRLKVDTFTKSTSYDFLVEILAQFKSTTETILEAKKILYLTYFTDVSLLLDPEAVAYSAAIAGGKITKDRTATVAPPYRSHVKKVTSLIAKDLKESLLVWTSATGILHQYSSKSEFISVIKQSGYGEYITIEDVEKADMRSIYCVY